MLGRRNYFLSTFSPTSLLSPAVCKASSETESSTHLILLVLQLFKSSFILQLFIYGLVIWMQNSWLNTSFQMLDNLESSLLLLCFGPILGIFWLFLKSVDKEEVITLERISLAFCSITKCTSGTWGRLPLTRKTASAQITDFCFWKMGLVEPKGFWRSKLSLLEVMSIQRSTALQKNVIRSPRK